MPVGDPHNLQRGIGSCYKINWLTKSRCTMNKDIISARVITQILAISASGGHLEK